MDNKMKALVEKIDALLVRIGPLKLTWWSSMGEGGFKNNTAEFEAIYTEAISLLASVYGKDNLHYRRIIHFYNEGHLNALEKTEGLLVGTKSNLESGLLDDLRSQVLIDIKSDFLESARALLEAGQKDPAAVLACIVLEDSLKRLVIKSNMEAAIDKEMSVTAGLLLRARVIEKSTNQSIQNFKNLRNAALHAQWHEVSAESVGHLLSFLPMFIEKHRL
jgi:hypothetical protein